MRDEMTIPEVLRDPLIKQMLRADRVSLGVFASLLADAARRRGNSDSFRASAVADAEKAVA